MPSFEHVYLGVIVPLSILIPISIGIYRYKGFDKSIKVIFYYLLLNGCVNLLAKFFAIFKLNNLPILHVYTILEFLFISQFYLLILKDKKILRVIRIMMVIFPVLCVVNFLFFQSILKFNTNTRPLEALFVMMMSLSFFAQTSDYNENEKWMDNPVNWISTGLLLYFSGALFIFSFSNYTSTVNDPKYRIINLLLWNIHATLVSCMYLIFAKGLSRCKKG